MANLKDLSKKESLLSSGHRLCAGCGHSIVVRQLSLATETPIVVGNATGCMEVATTIFPYTAWKCSFIHCAFENVAATISGVETAYRALKKQGKLDEEFRFIAIGGDGGTYDIGFQSLSGMCERGHRMVYVCVDNEAYMNTGIQRSSATPMGASTTTTPAGTVIPGKAQHRKDLTTIMAAHNIPYVAQASLSHWSDLVAKTQRALEADGPAFINVLSPCPRGWVFKSSDTVRMARLAVETYFWPLYEVVNGEWKITHTPREKRPLTEWLSEQRRFAHLLSGGQDQIVEELQADVDRKWDALVARANGNGKG